MAPVAPGGGNTISPPVGKIPRVSASKRWCFTYNNYPVHWVAQMAQGLDRCQWIGVPEVGENETPHIQGYVEFPVKVRPAGYKGMPKEIHWEKCKGTRADNVKYCTKDGVEGKQGNLKVPRELTFPEMNKAWEKDVLKIIETVPDDRSIYWYYGGGNIGKTTFTKYLVTKHGAVIVSGKGADVRNAICTYLKDTGEFPELVVFPIPKSFNTDYLSYEALENIKDMLFYSGKYEGGQVCGPCPHLFVFANEPPDESRMMKDRWKIRKIM